MNVQIEKNNAHSQDYVSCFPIEERSKISARWDAKWGNLFFHDAKQATRMTKQKQEMLRELLQEIKDFCRLLPDPPLFFSTPGCDSRYFFEAASGVALELIPAETLAHLPESDEWHGTMLVFSILQLNELVELVRKMEADARDDSLEQWFIEKLLPLCRCPVVKELLEYPVVRLTVGLPKEMFENRANVRLGYLFEKTSPLSDNRNPLDPKNPFFPRLATLPRSWNLLFNHIRQAVTEAFPEMEPASISAVAPPILSLPAMTATHLPAPDPIVHHPIQHFLPPTFHKNEMSRELTCYMIINGCFKIANGLVWILINRESHYARLNQFPADYLNYSHRFNQKLESFLLQFPDCAPLLSITTVSCNHACMDLFMKQYRPPSTTYPLAINAMICSFSGFMQLILNIVPFLDQDFSLANSWIVARKNSLFFIGESLSLLTNLVLTHLAFYSGNSNGASESETQAYACAFPDAFRLCKDVPKECHPLEANAFSSHLLTYFLYQLGFYVGGLVLPKITFLLCYDVPATLSKARDTVRHLIGGVSRFFYHPTPHNDAPNPTSSTRSISPRISYDDPGADG